jgi:putative hydrolase
MSEIEADLHIHSIASGHALNTVYELASVAYQKGLKLIGITDHGPDMEGAPHTGYFELAQYTPIEISGVIVIMGCEANIIDLNGNIDLPEEYLKIQKIVFAGLHNRTSYKGKTKEEHTSSIVNLIRTNPYIHVISHPFRQEFPTDIEKIVKIASEAEVALEINCLVLQHCNYNQKIIEQYRRMVSLSQEYGVPLVISSDAHLATQIGDFSSLKHAMLEYVLLKIRNLIVNQSTKSVWNFLSNRVRL